MMRDENFDVGFFCLLCFVESKGILMINDFIMCKFSGF